MRVLHKRAGSFRTDQYNEPRRPELRPRRDSRYKKAPPILHFEGAQAFAQPPAEVRAQLTDARFLADCIPDRQSVAESSAEKVVCTIRPGFAFVRGTLEVT